MEVVVSLKDTNVAESENGSDRMAARIRGNEPTPVPPAFNTRFDTKSGGPERGRTADLFVANEALYQLSYRPKILRS